MFEHLLANQAMVKASSVIVKIGKITQIEEILRHHTKTFLHLLSCSNGLGKDQKIWLQVFTLKFLKYNC